MINLGTCDDDDRGEDDSLKCGATLKSRKGTVRGVKNRVRQGIATFLRDKSKKVRNKLPVFLLAIPFCRECHIRIVRICAKHKFHLLLGPKTLDESHKLPTLWSSRS